MVPISCLLPLLLTTPGQAFTPGRRSSFIHSPPSPLQKSNTQSSSSILNQNLRLPLPLHAQQLPQNNNDPEFCEIGVNTVEECASLPATQSQFSAATNIAKCICGAGSFALPHVFLEEGVLGGTLAMTVCSILAAYTMDSLAQSKAAASSSSGTPGAYKVTSYVELAEVALGKNAANLVFALTLSASIGVCSTYLVFNGQIFELLSYDETSENIIRQFFSNISEVTWEAIVATLLYPLSLIRNYGIFAWTSALGVVSVIGGIVVTLASGILVDPGGGLGVAFDSIKNLQLLPESLAVVFGGSFGTIAYLFCLNFLMFPVNQLLKGLIKVIY